MANASAIRGPKISAIDKAYGGGGSKAGSSDDRGGECGGFGNRELRFELRHTGSDELFRLSAGWKKNYLDFLFTKGLKF
jgi:hypothetical protein